MSISLSQMSVKLIRVLNQNDGAYRFKLGYQVLISYVTKDSGPH